MNIVASVVVLYSVLFPSKAWYAPNQPIDVTVRDVSAPVSLILLDFLGKPLDPQGGAAEAEPGKPIDVRQIWPQLNTPGTYVLLAVPHGKGNDEFVGTPLVIGVRDDKRRDAPPGPMVVKVEPLSYAMLSTEKGDMTLVFFYDAAPHTVSNFLSLARGGFFDGLTFHRIVPGFLLQTGDPRGDGTGGPGYHLEAEFSGREHRPGVLSMARQGDPIEAQGAMPRAQAANSAGSQFFICLDYEKTKQLDGRYTVFGQVVDGMNVVTALGAVPTDQQTERPKTPQIITSIKVFPVTAAANPYAALLNMKPAAPTTQP